MTLSNLMIHSDILKIGSTSAAIHVYIGLDTLATNNEMDLCNPISNFKRMSRSDIRTMHCEDKINGR